MSIQVNVPCVVTVKVDTGSSNALQSWCESQEGFSIREQVFQEPIYSDSQGGSAGPPVDILVHGEIHIITFTSVRFDPTVDAKVCFVRETADGVSAANCTLMFADSKAHRVLLQGANFVRNYLRVMVSERELGRIGSHASVRQVTLTCYPKDVSGTLTLWNSTTT